MKFQIVDRVLHIIYIQKDKTSNDFKNICQISEIYEGVKTSSFIGFNFPMKIVPSNNSLYKYKKDADYVIVYKNGDKHTKMHELCHAKFYINKEYKESVYSLWNSLTKLSKKNIINMLLKMKYKNEREILIDEFQAYYYTEKSNFFGKVNFC